MYYTIRLEYVAQNNKELQCTVLQSRKDKICFTVFFFKMHMYNLFFILSQSVLHEIDWLQLKLCFCGFLPTNFCGRIRVCVAFDQFRIVHIAIRLKCCTYGKLKKELMLTLCILIYDVARVSWMLCGHGFCLVFICFRNK